MSNDEHSRKQRLRRYLDSSREAILWKAAGLTEQQARQPMTPTGTTVLGIVNHLAFTEFGYFSYCLQRPVHNERAVELFRADDPLADFIVEADVPAGDVLQFYRDAIAASDSAFDQLSLDAPASVPWWGADSETSLEHLMVHMCTETARHAGHLDLLREMIDGIAGLSADNDNLPELDAEAWRQHYERLQRIADSM